MNKQIKKCHIKYHCEYRNIKIHLKGKVTDEVFDSPKEVFEGKCILEPIKGKCPYE